MINNTIIIIIIIIIIYINTTQFRDHLLMVLFEMARHLFITPSQEETHSCACGGILLFGSNEFLQCIIFFKL